MKIYQKVNGRYKLHSLQFEDFKKQGIYLVNNGLMNSKIFIKSHLDIKYPVIDIKKTDLKKFLDTNIKDLNSASDKDIVCKSIIFVYQLYSGDSDFNIDLESIKNRTDKALPENLYTKKDNGRYQLLSDISYPADGLFLNLSGFKKLILPKEHIELIPEDFIDFLYFESMILDFYHMNSVKNTNSLINFIIDFFKMDVKNISSNSNFETCILNKKIILERNHIMKITKSNFNFNLVDIKGEMIPLHSGDLVFLEEYGEPLTYKYFLDSYHVLSDEKGNSHSYSDHDFNPVDFKLKYFKENEFF